MEEMKLSDLFLVNWRTLPCYMQSKLQCYSRELAQFFAILCGRLLWMGPFAHLFARLPQPGDSIVALYGL